MTLPKDASKRLCKEASKARGLLLFCDCGKILIFAARTGLATPEPMVLDRVVYRAVADGDIDAVKIALANGADVNDRFVRQELPDDTMLCVASERSHCDLVKLLLERGADPNMSDNEGADYRPLDLARDERTIDLLVAYGADVDHARIAEDTGAGETALMYQVLHFRVDCVRALLRNRASFGLRNIAGRTALDIARGISGNALGLSGAEEKLRAIIDLLTAVENAGSWKAYVREPAVALLSLRYLCLAGRATPPPRLARCFGAPSIPAAGEAQKRVRSAANSTPLPDDVFEHILTFWNFAGVY